jgi:hypothetical protein
MTTTLTESNPDIQNLSFSADPRPGNPLGFRLTVWTYADPDAKDPAEQKRGLAVHEVVKDYLATHSPACTGVTYRRV